ncbi:hypothetical protein [Serratia quinivorans]|uniref:hypothetical protein n=1 Tax=Serratia quinivorans TaxID=137545 RepID=UPI003F96462D
MSDIKLLYISKFYYSIYSVDDKFAVSVVFFNSYIDTSTEFWLTKDDIEKYKTCGELYSLVEKIRLTPDQYKDRELPENISSIISKLNTDPIFTQQDEVYDKRITS